MKKPTSKAVNNSIRKATKNIKLLLVADSGSRWNLAYELYTLDISIPWKSTKYGSFTKYCAAELDITQAMQMSYRVAYGHAVRLGYSMKDIKSLSKTFSFHTLYEIFSQLKKKVAIRSFVKKFKGFQSGGKSTISKSNKVVMHNIFNFILDDKHSKKMIALLQDHGMTITPKGMKQNVSSAMASFLDSY